jgi:hypothetical protein
VKQTTHLHQQRVLECVELHLHSFIRLRHSSVTTYRRVRTTLRNRLTCRTVDSTGLFWFELTLARYKRKVIIHIPTPSITWQDAIFGLNRVTTIKLFIQWIIANWLLRSTERFSAQKLQAFLHTTLYGKIFIIERRLMAHAISLRKWFANFIASSISSFRTL